MKLCDLETSKALQALGYNGEYNSYYLPSGKLESIEDKVLMGEPLYEGEDYIPAPRLDDAAYWLRDKHGLFPAAVPMPLTDKFYYRIYQKRKYGWVYKHYGDAKYTGADEALEEGVKEAIKLTKSKQTK